MFNLLFSFSIAFANRGSMSYIHSSQVNQLYSFYFTRAPMKSLNSYASLLLGCSFCSTLYGSQWKTLLYRTLAIFSTDVI